MTVTRGHHLEGLQSGLADFTAALYRQSPSREAVVLNEAVRHAISVARDVAAERKLVEDTMGAALRAIAASVAAEWRALDVAGLQFWQRDTAQLVLIALVSLAALLLLIRAAMTRTPGRREVILPAILRGGSTSARCASWVRHAPVALFVAGLPFAVLAVADPYTSLVAENVTYPGPPHRADDRRVRQHADVVQGRHAQHPQRGAAGVFHDGGRRRSASSSCGGPASIAT